MSDHEAKQVAFNWQPIETAPKDNKRPLLLASFDDRGVLSNVDFNGSWECERESWEMPQEYYFWDSANGMADEPTHWAYQPEGFAKLGRPPTPIGWSDTDFIKHLEDQARHPLEGLHINRGSVDAAADAYEAEYYDSLKRDAERYRFLSCKGVPPYFHRCSRWRLEYWNGEWWDPLMKEELDAAIDAQIEQEKANGSR